MKKFGIACDCHNTLVNSNIAWINAFSDFTDNPKRQIALDLYGFRMKRLEMSRKYNVDYDMVEKRASMYIHENEKLKRLLILAAYNDIPLFVVSNAPYAKVKMDLDQVGLLSLFKKIYSQEDGGKRNKQIFDEIIENNDIDMLLFLGNEEFDDNIDHPNVLSFALTSFLLERFDIIKGYNIGRNGRVI